VRRQGKRHVYKSLVTIKAWERLTAHAELDEATKADLKRHFGVWKLAREHVGDFNKQLEELAAQRQAQVDRLQTVPGIGPVISVTVLAYLGDVERFESAKHAASYAGLVPSTYDSADTRRHGRITAEGSPALRRALVLAAQHAGRKGNPLNRSFTRVMVKKSRGTAIVASANRLARICYSMLKHERDFDPTRFASPKWQELRQIHQPETQRAAG
jgi:transposase